MEIFFKYHLTWFFFGIILLLCLGLYLLLRIVSEVLRHIHIDNRWETWIAYIVRRALLFYPFAAGTLLVSIWVFVNPIWHGTIVLFIVFVSFEHLRNKFRGILLKAANEISKGVILKIGDLQGEVSEMGQLGLSLQNNDGRHFITYQKLFDSGYVVVQRPDVAGFCMISVLLDKEQKIQPQVVALKDLLITTPYVDWSHPLQINSPEIGENTTKLRMKIFLRESHYKSRLLQLMEEWGYNYETLP